MIINKSQFVEELAANTGTTVSQAERMVNNMFSMIYEQLKAGNKVNFSGFGQFLVSHREPRAGVNPRLPTQRIMIPALDTPKFKSGQAFKDAVKLRA